MDQNTRNHAKKYDRVMPRVYNRSKPSLKSGSCVMRHDTPCSSRRGGKPSVTNVSSSVFSDLPTVLNDYNPVSASEMPVKPTFVVKPRKTVKSLDPSLSPPRPQPRHKDSIKTASSIQTNALAPSVRTHNLEMCTDSRERQCYKRGSYSKLKELKDEIKVYQETEKLIKLRSHLYKTCGVVLDDVGQPAANKAVQVEDPGCQKWNDDEKDNNKSYQGNLNFVWVFGMQGTMVHTEGAKGTLGVADRVVNRGGAALAQLPPVSHLVLNPTRMHLTLDVQWYSPAPLTNGSAGSPLGRAAGSPPVSGASGAGPSPMAALMSVADTLPPGSPRSAGGSPPQPPPQRSASRSSQHSPNSSGSNGGRRSSGSRHVSSTTSVSSTEAGEGADAAAQPGTPLLKCTLCQERLEDTHFVQCPSQTHHKFCFPCSRDSIKRQQGSEVYCPSGEKCPLANSTVPWAFMQGEIATILGEEFKPKKERET